MGYGMRERHRGKANRSRFPGVVVLGSSTGFKKELKKALNKRRRRKGKVLERKIAGSRSDGRDQE